MDHNTNQTKQVARPNSGGAIDGFTRVSRGTALQPLSPTRTTPKTAPKYVAGPPRRPVPSTAAARKPHSLGVTAVPHAPQHATTLMRSAVKKPTIKSATIIKAKGPADLLAKIPLQTVAPKMSFSTINRVRHLRAERMIKSPAVSRYAPVSAPSPVSPYSSMSASASSAIEPQWSQLASRPTPVYATPISRPATSEVHATRPAQHPFQRPEHQSTAVHTPSTRNTAKPDIFELAMAEAISHEQTYDDLPVRVKKRGRALRYVTASFVSLFLIGFLTYQNAPSLSLKIASYRAGLHASLPAHQPDGFALGYLEYQPGNVIANFTSAQDGRQYNITQKTSSWDSQALLSNFVAGASSAYKTYQRAGRTVYVLGNNTATWVDNGIWYTVDGNSSLSSKQVLDLASSM